MKNLLLISMMLLVSIGTFAQSKKVLDARITALSAKIETLTSDMKLLIEQNLTLKAEIENLKLSNAEINRKLDALRPGEYTKGSQPGNNSENKSTPVTTSGSNRCKAITAAGNQCSRNADAGSDYCWQHKKSQTTTTAPASGNTNYSGSHDIQTGPRGGQYYINSHGKKTYIKRK